MIQCIAIDDEPLALEVIKSHCSKIPFIQLEKTFTQTSEASEYLKNFPIDLIFLDIQMPDINGVDFFKTIKQDVMVIFTTAFSQFAVEGFNVNAIDYLIKPIQLKRFDQACSKANNYYEYLKQSNTNSFDSLYVRSEYALVKIPFNDIFYLETMDDYIKIHLISGEKVLTLMSMKKMLEKLPSQDFIRTHRSYIVSRKRIKSVRSNTISLGTIDIPIGVSYEKDFFKAYSGGKN